MRNIDLHRELQITSVKLTRDFTQTYLERAEVDPNPLVVKSVKYVPDPNASGYKRRPRNIFTNPLYEITQLNATVPVVSSTRLYSRPRPRITAALTSPLIS